MEKRWSEVLKNIQIFIYVYKLSLLPYWHDKLKLKTTVLIDEPFVCLRRPQMPSAAAAALLQL